MPLREQSRGHRPECWSRPSPTCAGCERRPLWWTSTGAHLVSPSGQAATEGARVLVAARRGRRAGTRLGRPDAVDPASSAISTRTLGIRKARDALLQTPVFRGGVHPRPHARAGADGPPLEGFRMIDPTCGSGHFLLGAFDRPAGPVAPARAGDELQARVQTALDAIHGVDLNPFAWDRAVPAYGGGAAGVRPAVAGKRAGVSVPPRGWRLAATRCGAAAWALTVGTIRSTRRYRLRVYDRGLTALRAIRKSGAMTLWSEPAYITVKEPGVEQAYRRYSTCSASNAMTVPFMQRFFNLRVQAPGINPAGWVVRSPATRS